MATNGVGGANLDEFIYGSKINVGELRSCEEC